MKFSELNLIEPLQRAIKSLSYLTPTPVQQQAIPLVLEGRDLMASAQTGSGKTAAFIIPALQRLHETRRSRSKRIKTLVLTPTRELAAQVQHSADKYGKHLDLTSAVVFGGVNIRPQIRKLNQGVELLVATPGRLLDLHQQDAVIFDDVTMLVLDEADRMLDMGFIRDLKKIQSLLPVAKQTLMFSATFSAEIRQLAKTMLNEPVEVDTAPRNSAVTTIKQMIHPVDKKQKSRLLAFLIGTHQWQQVLVFTKTKHGANKLVKELTRWEIPALAIHGNRSQSQRTKALAEFKNREIDVLVATDIAARGIDIHELPHVVNFDLPQVAEDYVHRIGRTGRAGKSGEAISLVCADEIKQLRDIERLIKRPLERQEIEGFEPDHQVPESKQTMRQNENPSKSRPRNNRSRGNVASFNKKPRRPRGRKASVASG